MMKVCRTCWRAPGENSDRCPSCGEEWTPLDHRSYLDTAIQALSHADEDTAIRAADVLARHFDADESIDALVGALRRRWREPIVAAGIVRALARFAPAETRAVMAEAMAHESIIVRAAAATPVPVSVRPGEVNASRSPEDSCGR